MTDAVANDVPLSSNADSIRAMLRRLEELSSADLPRAEFFERLLSGLVNAVGIAGSIWWIDANRSLSCVAQHRLDAIGLAENLEATRHHQVLLTGAFQSEQPSLHRLPHLSAVEHVCFVPIDVRGRRAGVIDLFLARGGGAADDHEMLPLLSEAASLVTRYLERISEAGQSGETMQFFDLCSRFLEELHGAPSGDEVAQVAVNELRRLFVMDRVSLFENRRSQFALTAVSGQAAPDRRSNQIQALAKLVRTVAPFEEPFVYGGGTNEWPAHVSEALGRYLEQAQSRMVMVRPLRQPAVSSAFARAAPTAGLAPPAVIVFEQFADSHPKPAMLRFGEQLSRQAGLALQNARRYERLLIVPGLRQLSGLIARLRGRRIHGIATAALCAAAAVVALCAVPGQYRVDAKGRLMPAVRQHVFAPWDGEIVETFVSGGQEVRPGDKLFRVDSPGLRSDLLLARSRFNEKQKLLRAIEVEHHASADRAARDSSLRLQAQLETTRSEVASLRAQLELLEQQFDDLTVRAPAGGTVALLDATEKLLGRPVRRGEHLLDVMDQKGEWRLEVAVPERLSLPLVQAVEAEKRLPVDFRLLAAPTQVHAAQLTVVDDQTRPTAQGESVLYAFADLDEDALPHLHIGSDVVARIDCGRRPLMQIYFGELVDFIRRRLWL